MALKHFSLTGVNFYDSHDELWQCQLALYTVSRLVNFVHRWTNLELKYASPIELADIYFNLFPKDKLPVWLVSLLDSDNLKHSIRPSIAYSQGLVLSQGGGEGRKRPRTEIQCSHNLESDLLVSGFFFSRERVLFSERSSSAMLNNRV